MPLRRLERLAAMLLAVLRLATFKSVKPLLPRLRGRDRLLLPPAILWLSAARLPLRSPLFDASSAAAAAS